MTKKQQDRWYVVILNALYLSNLPQLLQKIFKPEDYLWVIKSFNWELEKNLIFMRGLFIIVFVLIIPIIIALIFSSRNLYALEHARPWGMEIGKYFYWGLWFVMGALFMFYFLTELAGIGKI